MLNFIKKIVLNPLNNFKQHCSWTFAMSLAPLLRTTDLI